MYGNLIEKIQILKSFDEKHMAVLNALMADKDFKLPSLASQLGYQVSTVRNFLTDIYKACGVPESEEDKRGYIVREYSEAYLKKDQIPPEPPKPVEEEKKPIDEPHITITPAQPRVNHRGIITVGILVVVGIVVISLLVSILQGLNQPNPPTYLNDDSYQSEPTTAKLPLKSGEHDWFEDFEFADGLFFELSYSSGPCYIDIWINNLTESNYVYEFKSSDIQLTDEHGNIYTLIAFNIDGTDYSPDQFRETVNAGYREEFYLCFSPDRYPDNARYIYLTFKGINRGSDLTYRYDRFQ